jgi:hypothetical protein
MESDDHCYTFKRYESPVGLYSSIDVTYIVHLEGNGRLANIEKQLELVYPTRIVYILFDKGFKKCKKNIRIENTQYDITHANIKIFKHAKENNYSNILIMEDDFIFNRNIVNKEHVRNIDTFIRENAKERFIYHLGASPYLVFPRNTYTYYSLSAATHATIFTRPAQDFIMNYDNKIGIDDWEWFLVGNIIRYVYYTPLCYQTFPNTENKANWNISTFVMYVTDKYIEFTKFDVQPEPGASYLYLIAKIISFILFLCLVYILYKVFSYFKLGRSIVKLWKSYGIRGVRRRG